MRAWGGGTADRYERITLVASHQAIRCCEEDHGRETTGEPEVLDTVHPVRRASTSIGTMPPSFMARAVLAIIALAPSPWMS